MEKEEFINRIREVRYWFCNNPFCTTHHESAEDAIKCNTRYYDYDYYLKDVEE